MEEKMAEKQIVDKNLKIKKWMEEKGIETYEPKEKIEVYGRFANFWEDFGLEELNP